MSEVFLKGLSLPEIPVDDPYAAHAAVKAQGEVYFGYADAVESLMSADMDNGVVSRLSDLKVSDLNPGVNHCVNHLARESGYDELDKDEFLEEALGRIGFSATEAHLEIGDEISPRGLFVITPNLSAGRYARGFGVDWIGGRIQRVCRTDFGVQLVMTKHGEIQGGGIHNGGWVFFVERV